MKRVLLIADGGTLGTYTAEECLNLGYSVDVICPADIYTEQPADKYEWVHANYPRDNRNCYYGKAYDRAVDNPKVLKATGLKTADF